MGRLFKTLFSFGVFIYIFSLLGEGVSLPEPPPPKIVVKVTKPLIRQSSVIDLKVQTLYVNGRKYTTYYR
jgi:hypothetical protein